MKKNDTRFSQLAMITLSFLAIGLCGHKLSLITNTEIHPELALTLVLALVSKGRTIYACVLGSLILQCVLGVFSKLDAPTIAVMGAWTALTTLVYCKASLFAIRSFIGTQWRDLVHLQDFIKLLALGGLLASLIPAASLITIQGCLQSALSLKLLSLEFLRTWLDISIGAFVFLPVFLGILLRNAPTWRGRWKAMSISGLFLIGASCYVSLTGREFEGVLSKAQIKDQTASILSLVDARVATSEEAVLNFAQLANIRSADIQQYLVPLAQRIFQRHPSVRSLSVILDHDLATDAPGTTPANSKSLDRLDYNLAQYETYKFTNPNYPTTTIDPDILSHYANAKTTSNLQLAPQNLQRFNLVQNQVNSLIVSYQAKTVTDPWSRHPTDSAKGGALIYIDIDLTQFAPTQITNKDLHQVWVNTKLKMNQSPISTEAQTSPALRSEPNELQIASFRLFDQMVTLQASQTSAWRADQMLRVTLPIKLLKLLLCSTYVTAIFTIFTRRNLVRLLIARQIRNLRRQDDGLNLFKYSIEQSQEAIAILRGHRDDLRIIYSNRTLSTLSGYSEQELIGKDWSVLIDYPINQKELTTLRQTVAEHGSIQAELMAFNQTAEWFWVDLRLTPIDSIQSSIPHWVLIQQDISQRKKTELEIRRTALEAQDNSLEKSRFLANMSHEIRTPLSGIIGLSNLAQQTADPQAIQKYLKTIQLSAQLQLEIITSILTTLKIEVGQTQLNLQPLELKPLLNQTADIVRPNALLKNIALDVKISPNVPERIEGDSVFLRQILLNLASNAIKFTTHGAINISVDYISQHDQTVRLRFSVEDSGPGLGSLSLAQITKPFFKGNIKNEINNDGLGLGLAIVESFLQLMGSHLQVKNINALGGASFYFDLDCKYHSLNQQSAPPYTAPPHAEIENAEWTNAFVDLRFLLIEDNLINQLVVQGYLQHSGAHLDIASTGASALSKLASTRYDLVLLDLRIPNFDTITVSEQIKNNPINFGVSIIGISASQQEDYKTTLQRYGLIDFLPKPIEQRLLFEAINKCMYSKTAEIGLAKNSSNLTIFSKQNTGQTGKLKRLFLKQALALRSKIEEDFLSNSYQALMDTLHLLQGSAAVIAESDLQQAAVEFENSIRTQSSDVEQFLKFIQIFEQSIVRTRQQLNPPSALATTKAPSNTDEHEYQKSIHINILLVDDNELICEALGNQMMEKSLSVDFAHTSEEALLKLDTRRYDVILSDLVLPDMDGLALSKTISSQYRFKDQIIFGLSAHVSEAIAQECLDAGMKKLYSKLAEPSALLAALVDAVEALKKS